MKKSRWSLKQNFAFPVQRWNRGAKVSNTLGPHYKDELHSKLLSMEERKQMMSCDVLLNWGNFNDYWISMSFQEFCHEMYWIMYYWLHTCFKFSLAQDLEGYLRIEKWWSYPLMLPMSCCWWHLKWQRDAFNFTQVPDFSLRIKSLKTHCKMQSVFFENRPELHTY